jgi:ABC-2 type transport system ATP-binding protein
MPEYSVIARQLTRRFGSFVAVDHIDFEVRPGEVFGFLGANGAGKTTAIRMLCGLLAPSEGSASVAGFDLRCDGEKVKRVIGYMSQKFSLYDDLTLDENIEFYGGVYGLKSADIRRKRDALLGDMGLDDFARKLTRDIPVGFKQRLALGCSLLHDPPVLFLDEPTSGVDPAARRQFWDIIYRLAGEGKTVFVTTHFMDEAEYCHRVSVMQNGKIIALDTPDALKTRMNRTSMQEVFIALIGGGQ